MRKKCSFCQSQVLTSVYACKCDENVIACIHCHNFGCYKCSKALRKLQLQFCSMCFNYQLGNKMYHTSSSRFCLACCIKNLKLTNLKQIKLNHNRVRRQQLEDFVNNFCKQCTRTLSQEQKRQVQDNKCFQCLSGNQKKQLERKQQPQQNKNIRNQSPQKSKAKQKQQELSRQELRKKQKQNQLQQKRLRQKWKKQQRNNSYITCISCSRAIFDSSTKATITEQVAICQICSESSRIQEKKIDKLNNSKMISNLYEQKKQRQDRPFQRPSMEQNIMKAENDQIRNEKQEQQNSIKQKQNQKLDENKPSNQQPVNFKKPDKKNIIEQQKNPLKSIKKSRIIKQPILKKSDSQAKIQNTKLETKWVNDSEMIQCANCSIQIEGASSIWQQQQNKPLCRRCFSDHLAQILNSYSRRSSKRTEYMRYDRGNYTGPRKAQNAIDQPSSILQRQRYKQKRFSNNSNMKGIGIEVVSEKKGLKQEQKLQSSEQKKQKLQLSKEQIMIQKNNSSMAYSKNDLIQSIKKKTQENQRIKPKQQKPTSEKTHNNIIQSRESYYNYQEMKQKASSTNVPSQTNKRWSSSYKPSSSTTYPSGNKLSTSYMNTSQKNAPYKIQDYRHSAPCPKCGRNFTTTKPYSLDNKNVCLECYSNYSLIVKKEQEKARNLFKSGIYH